jgi:hypothetical protein
MVTRFGAWRQSLRRRASARATRLAQPTTRSELRIAALIR